MPNNGMMMLSVHVIISVLMIVVVDRMLLQFEYGSDVVLVQAEKAGAEKPEDVSDIIEEQERKKKRKMQKEKDSKSKKYKDFKF